MMNEGNHKAVLAGVPRAGYDIHLCPFPGSLYSVLEYLGAPCDYDYIMGMTGAAFRRFWNRDDGGNIDLFYLGGEPARRIFEVLGYEWRPLPAAKPDMIAAIKESIGRGVPVIAFGIIGPSEAGIVTGYAEDDDTLYGWSYFQEGRDAYYEKPGWFEARELGQHAGLDGIIIGARNAVRPPERQVFIEALRWAVHVECATTWPGVADHVMGLAAYEAWAQGLEADADFPAGDTQTLAVRVMIHGDQAVMLEERRSAAAFLRQAAVVLPEAAAFLEEAAMRYEQAQGLMGRIWLWGESMGADVQQGLTDPASRRDIAAAIREAGKIEAQAVELLQQALDALTGGA
jgi:hypothetical protein